MPVSNTAESPNPWFTMIANTVVARIPISRPPFTLRATSVDVMARPTTNTRTCRLDRSGFSVISVAGLPTTMPPFTRPDDRQEQADPDPDRAFQVHRDRVQHRLAEAREHQERDDRALDHDDAHRLRPREPQRGHERERDERVQPEPRRDRERVVRVDAHGERHDARDEGRHGQHRGNVSVVPALSLTEPRMAGLTNRM